jgi:ABC-2 type transport system permease protein
MNSNFAEAATAETPPPVAVPAGAGVTEVLLMLVRREFWEHRALWIAPLVTAGLLALSVIFAHVRTSSSDEAAGLAQLLTPQDKLGLFSLVQWGVSVPLYLVMVICVSFYLLDCLYAERKDRSILFWKSLPVSDGLTVVSKLLTALLIVPLGVFVLAIATHFVCVVLWEARVAAGNVPAVMTWDTLSWLRLEAAMLGTLLLSALWYAPVAAYLLLVSAWARRNPFLWATLPVVVAPLLEWYTFRTRFVSHLINYRLLGVGGILIPSHDANAFKEAWHHRSLGAVLDQLHIGAAFSDIDLWLGAAVAAALVFAAVRIRRYRDDT